MKPYHLLFAALLTNAEAQPSPVAALQNICVGLKRHASELVIEPPVLQMADETGQREQGWGKIHYIRVVVTNSPSQRVAGELKATGQNCHFDVGLDLKTVAITKRACMALCKDISFSSIVGTPYVAYFGSDGSRTYMK